MLATPALASITRCACGPQVGTGRAGVCRLINLRKQLGTIQNLLPLRFKCSLASLLLFFPRQVLELGVGFQDRVDIVVC